MKKFKNITALMATMILVFGFIACSDDEEQMQTPDFSGQFELRDQMARPAINTVFVSSNEKDVFNTTVPSEMGPAFTQKFVDRLLALNPGYTTNALGLDAKTFCGVLATDILSVSTSGVTTFFDGTNVLTGRALADDVIDVELLLLFGGPDGTMNPGLTSDNVDSNDKAFTSSFPYLASPW